MMPRNCQRDPQKIMRDRVAGGWWVGGGRSSERVGSGGWFHSRENSIRMV